MGHRLIGTVGIVRQLFHWRLFAALGALVLLALGVDQAFGVTAPTGALAASGPVGRPAARAGD